MTLAAKFLALTTEKRALAFEHGNNGNIFVQKAPAATVQVLTHAILELMGKPDHMVKTTTHTTPPGSMWRA